MLLEENPTEANEAMRRFIGTGKKPSREKAAASRN